MHILLTDVLRCPRCGPRFGLILLADLVEERRVVSGRLGCPNCREAYPVAGGEPDLRVPGGEPLPAAEPLPADLREAAVRTAALLGLAEARGSVLLVGAGAELAEELASLLPEVEVVAGAGAPVGGAAPTAVNRVAGSRPLPFADASFRGVALFGASAAGLAEEGARVLAAPGRLLVEGAPAGTAALLAGVGLRVLLEQESIVVGERGGGVRHPRGEA